MNTLLLRTPAALWPAISLAAVLTACGGGGGSSGGAPAAGSTTPALSLSGTAATGAALADATVSVTCASGSGSAKTSTGGAYNLSLNNGSLPCVMTATSADGSIVLHSVAAGTGTGTAKSNITPLSELLLAQLSGTDPASYVARFDGTTAISGDAIASAQTALLSLLGGAGVDVSAVTDILSGALSAGSGTGYDGVLDRLQASIAAAGTSLGELSTTVAGASGVGSATGTATVSTLLAVSSSDCAALKSGAHRVVDIVGKTNYLATINASAMTATVNGGTYALHRNASCDYTLNDSGSTRVLVAKSGIAAWVKGSGASGSIGISLPVQTLDMASLGGVYNRSSYAGAASTTGDFGTVTLNASGVNTVSTNCAGGYGACTEDPTPQGHLAVNADGGFDYIDDGQGGIIGARLFGFRNAAGKTLLLGLESSGTLTILSAQAPLALPAVGTSNAFWQSTISSTGIGVVSEESNTITAVDAATGAVTRQFASDGHTDVVAFNAPYGGMRYRAANGCSPITCSPSVQVPLQGTGIVIAVSGVSTRHNMTVSINKP